MTDDRAREEFERSARAHIAARDKARGRWIGRSEPAATDRLVQALSAECDAYAEAERERIRIEVRHWQREAEHRSIDLANRERLVDALRDELTEARNAQQAPHGARTAQETPGVPGEVPGKAAPARKRTARPRAAKGDT
jgi:hypothetical protein